MGIMDVIQAIFERRSIRRYGSQAVSEEHIDKILRAAMMAPSARNRRAWHFVVTTDKSKLECCAEANPNASMAARAPLGIVVCADTEIEEAEGYWAVDCAAAIQNILLAAHDLELGAVWTAIYPREERISASRTVFELPLTIVPVALIVIGHPAETIKTPDRYMDDRIHRDIW